MRKIVFISLFSLILSFTLACRQSAEVSTDPVALVPPNTAVILKGNLAELAEKLQSNTLIAANSELPLAQKIAAIYHPLTQMNTPKFGLLCFTKVGKEDVAASFITPSNADLTESLKLEKTETYSYNGKTIQGYKDKEATYYGVELPGHYVFGNHQLVIENIIRLSDENIAADKGLAKVYKSVSDKKNSLIIQVPEFEKIYATFMPEQPLKVLHRFTNWMALDMDINKQSVDFKGVSIPEGNEFLGLFKGTRPVKNSIAQIVPSGAKGFYSFTYEDFSILKDNLKFYRKNDYPKFDSELFDLADEIGVIKENEGLAVVLHSTNPELTEVKLRNEGPVETFREHPIYPFSNVDYFHETLSPLVEVKGIKYYINIDEFFVFSAHLSVIEKIIAGVQSGRLLFANDAYRATLNQMDERASLLVVGNTRNLIPDLVSGVGQKSAKDYENIDFSNYHFGAIQFINHENFMYVHSRMRASDAVEHSIMGNQLAAIKPGEKIIAGPWFFENWRTKRYDVIIQGASNTLYAFDENGVQRWKKKINGRIIGDIQPIDIYQNGRIQMAFVTPQTFYIIDREGKVVKPFNKNFNEPITQALSVFDYNDNGRFRFPIVQGSKITLLDKNLKTVTGFVFNTTESPISAAPKHFRFGNKDYILIPESNGKLHILNVRGQKRVDVKEAIDFSSNPWYLHKNQFTSSDKKGRMIQINTDGKLTAQNLKLDRGHGFSATPNHIAYMSGNKLTINGKRINLDYGLYTPPVMKVARDKLYISVTDTQSHKTYVFDSAGRLIEGFPVYGNSAADLEYFGEKGPVKLAVQGEEDSVLIYEVN